MPGIQHVELIIGRFQLFVPEHLDDHRLIMSLEARNEGQLMALTSHCARPGPFDTLDDVHALIGSELAAFFDVVKPEPR